MAKAECIFCRIISGEVPSDKVFESDEFIVIRDIQPQARVHLLVIPKDHVDCLDSIGSVEINSKILPFAVEVARRQALSQDGFRVVINTRDWGGQSVRHLHLHLLGGEQLRGSFA